MEAGARLAGADPRLVPPPSAVVPTAVRLLGDPAFLAHVAATAAAWALGLLVATALGVGGGLVLGARPRIEEAARGPLELLRPIPSVALVPLAILLLGRGLDMKVVIVAYASTWPILINTLAGVRSVDRVTLETARSLRLPSPAVAREVVLPASAPYVLGGIRVAAGVALVLAVSAELIAGGREGIGVWMVAVSQAGVGRELLFAGILVTGALGLVLTGVVAALERLVTPWRRAAGRAW